VAAEASKRLPQHRIADKKLDLHRCAAAGYLGGLDLASAIRLCLFGLRMGSVTTPGKRRERLDALFTQRPDLRAVFMPLIECIEAMEAQLARSSDYGDSALIT